MVDTLVKITQMTDGGILTNGDIIPVIRGGANVKATYDDVIAYGQVYYEDSTPLTTDLTTENTFYPLVSQASFPLVAGLARNVTQDVTTGNGSITVGASGVYRVNYSVSYSSNGANYTYRASIFKNDVFQPSVASWRKVTLASTVLATSSCGLMSLQEGDVIDLRFACDTANAQVIAEHISFSLTRQHANEV